MGIQVLFGLAGHGQFCLALFCLSVLIILESSPGQLLCLVLMIVCLVVVTCMFSGIVVVDFLRDHRLRGPGKVLELRGLNNRGHMCYIHSVSILV